MSTGNLSGAPAYNRPQMSSYYQQVGVGPSGGLVSQPPRQALDMNMVNQQSNQLRNSLMQQSQGQSVRLGNQMAGRGFGSNSPAMIAQQSNLEAQARNAGSTASLQNRLQAYQSNNQMNSQWDQNYRQNELARMQMAMGLAGQDQQLYGTQLSYLQGNAQMQNEAQMQQKALENQLQIANINARGGAPFYGAGSVGYDASLGMNINDPGYKMKIGRGMF